MYHLTQTVKRLLLVNTITIGVLILTSFLSPKQTTLATTDIIPMTISVKNQLAENITKKTIQKTTEHTVLQTKTKTMPKPKFKKLKPETYCSLGNVNVRSKPIIKTNTIVTTLYPYQKVTVTGENKYWYQITYKNKTRYISKEYLMPESKVNKTIIQVPVTDNKFKSWMPYTAITSKNSGQYKLQSNAITGTYGIRQQNGRYCVAVGSYFNIPIGSYFDLILANGTTIPCVMADLKSNQHTMTNRIQTKLDGSIAEFIVCSKSLHKKAKQTGNISSCCPEWNSEIVTIIRYQ